MFYIDKEDKTIHITRGDAAAFKFYRRGKTTGEVYNLIAGDVVRFTVYQKKAADKVVLQKDFAVTEEAESIAIVLTKEDTKIGGAISKPVDYWYEIEVNPFSDPKTYVAYDEDGAKIFKLYPEGVRGKTEETITEEDIPVVDEELSLISTRPVQNQAIARAIEKIADDTGRQIQGLTDEMRSRVVTEIAKQFEDRAEQIESIIAEATADFSGKVDGEVAKAIERLGDEIYTTSNKPTAADIGAVPKTRALTSDGYYYYVPEDITIRKASPVFKLENTNAPTGSAVTVEHFAGGGGGMYLLVNANTYSGIRFNPLTAGGEITGDEFCFNVKGTNYKAYGGHNKPSGTYTGDNTATDVNIKKVHIGGVGKIVLIKSTYGMLFVGHNGGFGIVNYDSDKRIQYLSDKQLYLDENEMQLVIKQSGERLFNWLGAEYSFQLL